MKAINVRILSLMILLFEVSSVARANACDEMLNVASGSAHRYNEIAVWRARCEEDLSDTPRQRILALLKSSSFASQLTTAQQQRIQTRIDSITALRKVASRYSNLTSLSLSARPLSSFDRDLDQILDIVASHATQKQVSLEKYLGTSAAALLVLARSEASGPLGEGRDLANEIISKVASVTATSDTTVAVFDHEVAVLADRARSIVSSYRVVNNLARGEYAQSDFLQSIAEPTRNLRALVAWSLFEQKSRNPRIVSGAAFSALSGARATAAEALESVRIGRLSFLASIPAGYRELIIGSDSYKQSEKQSIDRLNSIKSLSDTTVSERGIAALRNRFAEITPTKSTCLRSHPRYGSDWLALEADWKQLSASDGPIGPQSVTGLWITESIINRLGILSALCEG
mgnify:CR=1 FL=1